MKVTATDRGGLSDSIEVKVIIRGENEPPVINGLSAPEFNENATGRITRYTATDPEKDSFTWSVAGADAGDFSIDSRGYLSINNPPDYETKSTYSVTIVATDDADPPYAGELPVTVVVKDVNEAPERFLGGATHDYAENGVHPVQEYFARDPEGDTPINWSLSGADGGDFSITNSGLVQFRQTPDYERPTDSNHDNIYRFTVRASDGSLTDTKDVTVTVGNINEAPTIRGDATLTFPENTATTRVLDRYSATHPERGQITWSLVGDDQNDFLIDQSGNLTFASMPDYESPSDSGGNNEYRVTVVATDDGSPSQVGRLDVTVNETPVNEPPSVIGQPSYSVDENSGTFAAFYSASDPEGGTTFTWSLAGTDGGDFTIPQGGQLTFRNTPDYERPADSNRDNIYNLLVRASGGRYYGYREVTVTVTPVNEAPEINSGSRTEFIYRENGTNALYTYRATDPERADIEWDVSGPDGIDFTISEGGVLSFTNPPDFENPEGVTGNVYQVTVEAEDGDAKTASLPVTVTVTDLNEGPTIAGNQNLSSVENTNTTQVLATYSAIDPEDTNAVITRWSLSGTDGGDFVINEGGQLWFRNTPDYERPADSNRYNIYVFSVRASDGRYYGYYNVTVTVTGLDEPPEIRVGSRDSFTVRENSTSVLYT